MTDFASEADVAELGEMFIARSLPKARWTHAGHFAAALYILLRRPDLDAARDMPDIIRAYNEATGVANTESGGYHETITQASLRGARAFAEAFGAARPLHEIANALMASPLGDKDWPLAYWSRETLFSPAARKTWTAPDRAPLPFP